MLLAPAATPKQIMARLHEASLKSLRSDSVRESFAKMGVIAGGSSTPAEARAYLLSEMERYRKLVKAIGLKLQ